VSRPKNCEISREVWSRLKQLPTSHRTVIGLPCERFVALGLPSRTHLRTRYWGVSTLKEFEDLLRELGLRYCESWGIGEKEKVKADSTTERCFGIAETWLYLA